MKDEEKQRQPKGAGWTKKSWFWPAAYFSAGAVILGAYFLIQSPAGTDQADEGPAIEENEWDNASGEWDDQDGDAMPTASGDETIEMPVMDEEGVDIIGYYYNHDAAAEEQQDALVYYNNMYYQNKGIDIAAKDGETFEVTAAATGEVIRAEKDSVNGYIVEVKHDDNIVTSYSSLEDLRVEEGDTITQGSVIGMAARNLYNSDAGIHAHFEVRNNGEPLDPTDAFHQKVKDVKQEDGDQEKKDKEQEDSEQDEADQEPMDPLADDGNEDEPEEENTEKDTKE
ncbi:M23 family metallopeptidase [Bacillus piscicola]|uniref:M23 family metallopeptidase n=1 Tax=Bacillus piscicola TaxID=1632684 RepID=UPI001F09322A|nr:M23 family metallopeptidase [Bacillus piscicola]